MNISEKVFLELIKKGFVLLLFFFFVFLNGASFKVQASSSEEEDDSKEGGPLFVLSLDGGGIRGVTPAAYLEKLEDNLQKETGSRVRLAECFDIIAGTSTGGLIALGLNISGKTNTSPRYDARFIKDFYINNGPIIFPKENRWYYLYSRNVRSVVTPKYDRKNLDDKVDGLMGKKRLEDAFSGLLIPAYRANSGALCIFDEKKNPEVLMRDAGLATSAAPYYFASHEPVEEAGAIYLDGGLICNNPALHEFQRRLSVKLRRNAQNGTKFRLSLNNSDHFFPMLIRE